MGGFVRIYRSLIGNPQFRGPEDEYAAIWLIVHAVWQATVTRVDGKAVPLERGQLCYSVGYLAQAWKCSKETAYRRLRLFAERGFIQTDTQTGVTRITICNYDDYQASPNDDQTTDQTDPKRSPNAAQTNKNESNEVKEGNHYGRTRRGTRIPPDWRPCEASIAKAAERGIVGDRLETAIEEYINYWIAVPGQRGTKLDWDRTFDNRIIQIAGRQSGQGAAGGNGKVAGGVVAALRRVQSARERAQQNNG